MHVHASASEGEASMAAQLVQAARTGVSVLWWTEHDHRMQAHTAPTQIRFSGLRETARDTAPWTWTALTDGPVNEARHDFVTPTNAPALGAHQHALHLAARSKDARLARHGLSGQAENLLNRTSLSGLTLTLDVLPNATSLAGFVAIEIVTSYRPVQGDQPAGLYRISYRIGGATRPGVSKRLDDVSAIVSLKAPQGKWRTLHIAPELDLVRLWPGIEGRDASLHSITLVASSRRAQPADAYFADLQFHRPNAQGQKPLAVQRQLMDRYSRDYPTVRQIQGLEISLTSPHLGWYGGTISLPDNTGLGPLPSHDVKVAYDAVAKIHNSGGLASYCHPFGTSQTVVPALEQDALVTSTSAQLIANRALGCDLLEVGYRVRGGCTLSQHETLWDNCSRNAIFLTGIGVSDDHAGLDWITARLNFVTWAWATDASETALLAALRRGRAFFGDLAKFHGTLDLRRDGVSVMGGVSISSATSQDLTVIATGLPDGGTVDVLVGTVDRAGAAHTKPVIRRTTLQPADFDATGSCTIHVDVAQPRFVRVVVVDAAGVSIALSNPTWFLRDAKGYRVSKARLTG